MDIGDICEYRCIEPDCKSCHFGNPCLGCEDYDREKDACTSNGACSGTQECDMEKKEA